MYRISLLRMSFLLLLAATVPRALAEPATRPAAPDPNSPKGTLLAWSQNLPAGGVEKAMEIYHAVTPAERVAARAMAEENLSSATLQKLVQDKWGKAACDKIIRAISDESDDDLLAADEIKEGDHVVIKFKDRGDDQVPLTLVRVDGKWKISIAAFLKDAGASGLELTRFCRVVTNQIDVSVKEFNAGQYADVDAMARVVAQRIKDATENQDTRPDGPAPV